MVPARRRYRDAHHRSVARAMDAGRVGYCLENGADAGTKQPDDQDDADDDTDDDSAHVGTSIANVVHPVSKPDAAGPASPSVGTMRTMPIDVIARNNVRVIGRGSRPLVFAHGFGCDQTMWRLVTPSFEADHRIVLFDYVGHGASDHGAYDPARYGTLDGFAADLLDVVEALDLRDVILVAHSVSSMIGVLAINRTPERFSRLVMIGPSPRYLNDRPDYVGGFDRPDIDGLLEVMEKNTVGWASALAPMVAQNPDRPELAAELHVSFCATHPAAARQFAAVTFLSDNRADLPRLAVPSLVLQCSEDLLAPSEVGQYVARTAPNSTFRQLTATGHCPHLSHPEETVRAIREYLAGVPAA